LAVCGALQALGQTQVDLRTQSKTVDFQAATFTRPLKTGSSLPPACQQGEMFFLTTASAGSNIYGCPSTDTWVVESGGGGAPTIQNSGVPVGSRPVLDLSTGAGVLLATSDTGQAITIQSSIDTSIVQTLSSEQAGTRLRCASASSSATVYTCSLSPFLTAYTTGMLLHWVPDVDGAGGATTLNVDTLGAVPVRMADGAANPSAGEIVAERMYDLWYDGTVFRMGNAAVPAGALGEARPTCDATARGRTWFQAGATGVQDTFAVCAKDAGDSYAWRSLY
jgi:hypothetical protein